MLSKYDDVFFNFIIILIIANTTDCLAWFVVYSTTLSQLLRMRVMATPDIFFILSIKY